MDFEEHDNIEIRSSADNWGPFSWNFSSILPTGATLSDVDLKAYLGKVFPDDDLENETETTDDIIDSDTEPSVSGNVVSAYFKHDSDQAGTKHTLVFLLTTDDTPAKKNTFYFHFVKIR